MVFRMKHKGLLRVFLLIVLGLGAGQSMSEAHDSVADRVGITLAQGQLFGITSEEGIARQDLGAGEHVLVMEAKGLTGFVQTSKRLFGFSGKLQRWVSINLPTSEEILKWSITSRLAIAQGQQAVYGFQSDHGRWKRESWGAGESLQDSVVRDSVAVVVTDKRALGFSALTGGFFSRDLPVGNQTPKIQANDHVIVLHLSDFMFVFRSGLGIWAELP